MTLAGLFKLLRPYYAVPMSLAYALTVYYALGGQVAGRGTAILLSTVSLMLAVAAGYAFNEICDVAVDAANPRRHAIALGQATHRAAAVVAGLLAASAIAIAAAVGLRFLLALLAAMALLAVYDLFSKRLGWVKPLLASALMTAIYPLALALTGWPIGSRAASLAIFPAWLFVTGVGYELLKDVRDCRTDPPVPHWRGPIRARPELYRRLAAAMVGGASPLLLLCLPAGCRWVFALGACAAVALSAAAAFSPVQRAIRLVYAEVFLIGLAAAADVWLLGM